MAPRAAGADSTAAVAPADSLAPRRALLRSALLPGWGQLYNGRPLKAALFAATSAALLSAAAAEQRALGRARNPTEFEERAARRNNRILWWALSVTFAALDAYVDAHLDDFDVELRADGAMLEVGIPASP